MAPFDFLGVAKRIGQKAMQVARETGGGEYVGVNPLGQKSIKADMELEALVAAELRKAKIPCILVSEESGVIEVATPKNAKWRFVLDPLDGSENYKRGIPTYALGLCYAPLSGRQPDVIESYIINLVSGEEFYSLKGKGVYRNGKRVKPSKLKKMLDAIISIDFYHEALDRRIPEDVQIALMKCADHRRFGPDLVDMCYAAAGGVDAFVHARGTLSEVHASGIALLAEDCVLTNEYGKPINAKLEVEERTGVVAAGTKELHASLMAALKR